jgi:glycine cleavage system H protein
MSETFYTREHEWVRIEGGEAVCGISDHAQELLGDITYLDLPQTGRTLKQFEKYAEIESVKAASDIYAPISGEIIAVNDALANDPSEINKSAENHGWIIRIKVADAGETAKLLDKKAYKEFLKESEM